MRFPPYIKESQDCEGYEFFKSLITPWKETDFKYEREVRVCEESIQEVQKKLAVFLQSPSPRDLSLLMCPILYFPGQSNYEISLSRNRISPSLNPKQSAATVGHWSCWRQGWRWRLWGPGCFRYAHHLPGTAEAQTDGQDSAQAQAKTHAQERSEKNLSSHILLILALQKQERKARAQLHYLPEDWSMFRPALKGRTVL